MKWLTVVCLDQIRGGNHDQEEAEAMIPQIGDIVQIELIGRVTCVEECDGKVKVKVSGDNWQYATVLQENIKEIVKP